MTARHRNSFRVLGPHDGPDGPRRPRLSARRAVGRGAAPRRSCLARNAARGAAGPVRRPSRRRVALSAADQVARGGAGDRGSLCLRGCAGRARPAPVQRGPTLPSGRCAGRQRRHRRRRAGRALRGLGAQRRARRGDRRFQFLGRAAPSHAAALSVRHLGAVRAAGRRRRALQVRHHGPGRRAPGRQGRSGGAAGRGGARHRLDRALAAAVPLDRRQSGSPAARSARRPQAPISIYEVHIGSWLQAPASRAARCGISPSSG